MAKKKKGTEENINENEDTAGSKVVTILIVAVIVLIWLAVFGVLIKLNIGNFGSDVLYPVLKDIPVVNRILPDIAEDYSGKYNFNSISEAVERIKELERELASSTDTNGAHSNEINSLKAEIERLRVFEQNQEAFAKRVQEFDDKVVFNDKAPELQEYKKFYEGISRDNAERIYKQVLEKLQHSQDIQKQADIYSTMDPAQAAKVFETMTGDLDLLANILDCMSKSKSALILQNMSTESAAQLTKKMTQK